MRKKYYSVSLFLMLLLAGCLHGPQELADRDEDWLLEPPQDVGIDKDKLQVLESEIRSGEFSNVHGLVIVRKGRIAYEAYFEGEDERRGDPIGYRVFDANTLHDVRSVTKSVVSILFGIAQDQHSDLFTDDAIFDHFPEYGELRTSSRNRLQISHALSMTTGLQWDESSRPYGHPMNDETAMDGAVNRFQFILEKPVIHTPGATWEYSGGDTMLLAKIIEKRTGEDIVKFANRVLFKPLGIEQFEWLRYDDGEAIAASGLRLTPRDMAKIGQLYLQGGRWKNQQIVPEDWVKDSLTSHGFISDRPTGFQAYGYQWWLGTARIGDNYVSFASAVGWGGQRILLVPEMDLVIVLTAGLYGQRNQSGITFEIMLDRILPAIL